MRVRIYQLICIIIFALPLAANGKTVALSSKSGDLEINGTLLDFDGRYYSIESEYGHVVLDSKLFECAGDGCIGNFGRNRTIAHLCLAVVEHPFGARTNRQFRTSGGRYD